MAHPLGIKKSLFNGGEKMVIHKEKDEIKSLLNTKNYYLSMMLNVKEKFQIIVENINII